MLGCPPSAVTLDNGACVMHSAPIQRLTFAEVAKTIKMYWLLTSEPPFRRGLAE